MTKHQIIQQLLQQHAKHEPKAEGQAFAPSNIALCKYWGKRALELNLPVTSSLSISLADKGALSRIRHCDQPQDQIYLNKQLVADDHVFAQRVTSFLDLFRDNANTHYRLDTQLNIPVAAGLASSACGVAALVLALDDLYGWQLDKRYLSVLARIGSGSAARSLWHGFVEWHAGEADDGMDSYAELIPKSWPECRIGLHLLHKQQKPISSREAMQRTVKTSTLYQAWPQQVAQDMPRLKQAIQQQDFELLGQTAEQNALAMHATMISSWPPVMFSKADTVEAMHRIWQLRAQGVPVYFTQDAGPNLKLLFLETHQAAIIEVFPDLELIAPFTDIPNSRPEDLIHEQTT